MSTAEHEPRSTFERALAKRTNDVPDRQLERVIELLEQGADPRARKPRRITLARVVGAVLGLLFLRFVIFGGTPARRGTEPIGAVAVATADGAGVGVSALAFLPPAPARADGSDREAAPSPEAPAPPAAQARPAAEPHTGARKAGRAPATATPRAAAKPKPAEPADAGLPSLFVGDDAPSDEAEDLLYAAMTGTDNGNASAAATASTRRSTAAAAAGAATAAPPAAFINIGTRLRATLEAPLRTGSSLAPATALLAEDVRVGDHVVLPAGTRLVGSAFATPHDDRVQILWRALVSAGRTPWGGRARPFQGETLGPDGAPGLAGKLIRRHKKGALQRLGAAVSATAGDVAAYAVPFGDSALEHAGAALAGRTARELGQIGHGREWLQASTVVELKAGTPLVVYVAADLELGEAGAP